MTASVPAQIEGVLATHGLNRIGAAGIIGNAYAESSYRPGATGYGGGGLWGFTASPQSLADLKAFAQRHHQPWTSVALQTQFLLAHVSRGLISRLNSAKTPEEAAAIFMSEWERPGIPRQSVREGAARRAFQALGKLPGLARRSVVTPSSVTHAQAEASTDAGGGLQGDLMHASLVVLLVVGGVFMVGFGGLRTLRGKPA